MTLHLFLVLALLLGTSEQQDLTSAKARAGALDCSPPFSSVGQSCIYVDYLTTGTWTDMRAYCQSLGADLVILHDANFFHELITYLKSSGVVEITYWVGGRDEGHEGVWLWIDGSPMKLGTPFWGYGSYQYPSYDETDNCAYLSSDNFLYMNDADCAAVMQAVCEMGDN